MPDGNKGCMPAFIQQPFSFFNLLLFLNGCSVYIISLTFATEKTENPFAGQLEKPRDFDPFGQTGFAHLWLQYNCPLKALVLGVTFILPF